LSSISEIAAANASKSVLANCVLLLDYILDLYEMKLGNIEKIKYCYHFFYYPGHLQFRRFVILFFNTPQTELFSVCRERKTEVEQESYGCYAL